MGGRKKKERRKRKRPPRGHLAQEKEEEEEVALRVSGVSPLSLPLLLRPKRERESSPREKRSPRRRSRLKGVGVLGCDFCFLPYVYFSAFLPLAFIFLARAMERAGESFFPQRGGTL